MSWTTVACADCGYRPGGITTQNRHRDTTGHARYVYSPPTNTTAEGTTR